MRDARGLLPARRALGERAGRMALVTPSRKPAIPLSEGVRVVSGWKLSDWL